MHGHASEIVVIQPGAGQMLVGQVESERLDQVEPTAGIGREADDVAGVGRDLGLEENDFEHRAGAFGLRLAGAKAATVAQPGIGVRATTRFPTQPAP